MLRPCRRTSPTGSQASRPWWGGLAGIGALVVSILSYLKSSRALASEKETLDSVGATLAAVEALGALENAARPDQQSAVPDDAHTSSGPGVEKAGRDDYEAALQEAQDKLATTKSRVFTITCPHCGSRFGPFSRVSSGLTRCGNCGKAFNAHI